MGDFVVSSNLSVMYGHIYITDCTSCTIYEYRFSNKRTNGYPNISVINLKYKQFSVTIDGFRQHKQQY